MPHFELSGSCSLSTPKYATYWKKKTYSKTSNKYLSTDTWICRSNRVDINVDSMALMLKVLLMFHKGQDLFRLTLRSWDIVWHSPWMILNHLFSSHLLLFYQTSVQFLFNHHNRNIWEKVSLYFVANIFYGSHRNMS